MRIQESEIVTASCVSAMERKDVNGGSIPVTDIQFSPACNDTTNSNGILSPPTTPSTTTPSENDYVPAASGSGRLKFFKDGKFILELWHKKEGERTLWTQPKDSTCWPSIGHCTPRQESSTSLSVSDDNSSIQSSPWQRDRWQKSVPKKNISRALEFSMHFLRSRKIRFSSLTIRRKRRRPFDLTMFNFNEIMRCDKEDRSIRNELKYDKEGKRKDNKTENLSNIIKKLLERRKYEISSNSCRIDPGIVSPRKRILKEMEKVSLEEMGNANKKHRARTVFNNTPGNTVTVITGTISGPTMTTFATHTAITASSTKSTNSHSISSILSRDEEPSFLRNLLKSPNDSSSESKSSFTAESPSSNDIRIVRPSHCSTPVTTALSASYSTKSLPYPPHNPAYIPSTYLYHTAQPYISSPPVSNHPPYYSAFPSSYRDSSVWSLPSVSSLPRQSVHSSTSIPSSLNQSPWVPVAHSSFQSYPVAENGTDVPLNLSKH